METSKNDIKLLWDRAACKCSICKKSLSNDKTLPEDNLLRGEEVHIIQKKQNISSSDEKKTNSYYNLILLCPECHKKIDRHLEEYPAKKLFSIKSDHELWVKSYFGLREENDCGKYQTIIKSAKPLIDDWCSWLTQMNASEMLLDEKILNYLKGLIKKFEYYHFSDQDNSLDRSIINLVRILSDLLKVYLLHAEFDQEKGIWKGTRFYLNPDSDAENLYKFEKWRQKILKLSIEATKAVNWFMEEVREAIDPAFYKELEKVRFKTGPDINMSFRSFFSTYSFEEKIGRPGSYQSVDEDEIEEYS